MHHVVEGASPTAPDDPEGVAVALQHLLGSAGFCKAQRLSRLLRFLVDKRLRGAARDTSEYVLGIEVFDRDPASYTTCDDPIVRVQMGRLREKLRAYYAGDGAHAALRISIPVGSYMPEILSTPKLSPDIGQHCLLALTPLAYFDDAAAGAAFTRGLNEELAHHLYKTFGQNVVAHTVDAAGAAGTRHRMEGSIRVHGEQLRATIRLVGRAAGCIVWSEQFNYCAPLEIALQEQLAVTICQALKEHFALG